MAQARLWLWGLIPLAAFWLIAILIETGPVEKDIGTRVSDALASAPWVPSEIATHGRDITLGGDAYDPDDRMATVATTDGVFGVRHVDDQSHLVPEAKPYAWSATKTATTVLLAGSIPKPHTRLDLLALAAQGGPPASDTMHFARGAPAGFDAAAALAVGQLQALANGKVSISDNTLSISGQAKDRAARDTIVTALEKLPPGFALGTNDVTIPTYDFSATEDPSADTLTLDGSIPDDRTRAAIHDLAAGTFAGLKVVDNTKIADGAPPQFAATVIAALRQLSRLDHGKLTMSDGTVDLTGGALYAKAIEQIQTALKSLPAGVAAKTEINPLPPGAPVDAAGCQQLFAGQLAKGKIQFETASAKIDTASAGLLDHLVAIALRCPTQALEISGHTDSSGSDQVNLDLSRRRAQAVVNYLVTAGLDATHLTAVGYGKTRPIASNDTDDGKAKNRRIEFLVK